MQDFLLLQIDRNAYLYMGIVQIMGIRFFSTSRQHAILPLFFILLALLVLILSSLVQRQVNKQETNKASMASRRQAQQLFIMGLLLLMTAISTFHSFYQPARYVDRLLEEGTASLDGLIVLDSQETSFGKSELTLRGKDQTGIRLLVETDVHLQYGDRLNARLDFKALEAAPNPGAFDERSYRHSLGIHLNASLSHGETLEHVEHVAFLYRLQRFARRLNDRICSFFVDVFGKAHGGLASAMLLGNEQYLSKDIKDDFKLSGLSHLLVVSGSNVSLVFTFLLPLLANSSLGFTARQFICLPALIFFGALINWDASVTRAIAMNIVIILAKLMRRPIMASTSLGIAVCFIVAFFPRTALQMGFLMSSVVSFALMHVLRTAVEQIKTVVMQRFKLERWWILIGDAKQRRYTAFLYAVLTPFISQIAVLPFTISLASESTVLAVVLNWFAVPLAGVLTLLLCLISPLFLLPVVGSKLLSISLAKPIHVLLIVLERLAAVPRVFNVRTFILSDSFIYLYILFLIVFLGSIYALKRKHVINMVAVYLMAFTLIASLRVYNQADLTLTFFSIGQGDSALLDFKFGPKILIDTGTEAEGVRTLLPAFRELDIRKLDAVIVSHMHLDHCGALQHLMDEGLVTTVYSPPINTDVSATAKEERDYQLMLMEYAENLGVNWQVLDKGKTMVIGDQFRMRCIHPDAKAVRAGNASSLILELEGLGIKILFTGDLEKREEEMLVQDQAVSAVDVLKVSHHGSNTSSTRAFLDTVEPSFSVISVGKNIYGHPHMSVLQSLEERNSKVFRTDEDGALLIEVKKKGWTIYRYMDQSVQWKGN